MGNGAVWLAWRLHEAAHASNAVACTLAVSGATHSHGVWATIATVSVQPVRNCTGLSTMAGLMGGGIGGLVGGVD